MYKEIKLTRGCYTLVDEEDYAYLNKLKWYAIKTKYSFYAKGNSWVNGKRIQISMHREIMKPSINLVVDHIDGNGLNNVRSNLRICTRMENVRSRHVILGKSKYHGVCIRKDRYHAKIRIGNGINKFIGSFKNEIEAAKAYDECAKKYHGEFAALNFKHIMSDNIEGEL